MSSESNDRSITQRLSVGGFLDETPSGLARFEAREPAPAMPENSRPNSPASGICSARSAPLRTPPLGTRVGDVLNNCLSVAGNTFVASPVVAPIKRLSSFALTTATGGSEQGAEVQLAKVPQRLTLAAATQRMSLARGVQSRGVQEEGFAAQPDKSANRAGDRTPRPAPVFRQQALRAQYEEPRVEPLPAVETSRWVALLFFLSAVGALVLMAILGRVEVTTTAAGNLVIQNGPRPVLAQASGVVRDLSVKAGERVAEGQVIARIEAEELRARVDKAKRLLEILRAEQKQADEVSARFEAGALNALRSKSQLLGQRAVLKKAQVTRREPHAERMQQMAAEGVKSRVEAMGAEEAAEASREELLAIREEIAEIGIQIGDRRHRLRMDQLNRALNVRQAEVGLAEAEALVVLGELRAPEAGRLESLLATDGQVIQAGALVARIVPDGPVSKAVVFAPADEAAFLRAGINASLEFPSLPVSEFGRARATVIRVGTDLALTAEVMDVLGTRAEQPGGLVRVELTPQNDATWAKMSPSLGSGARVLCRLETRKRRIVTLLFDSLRKWYPE